MDSYRIPFNSPALIGREQEYIRTAIESGHVSGDGPFCHLCHEFFEGQLGIEKALMTTSCTHALEMAAILLNLSSGDEVIVPSFTFVSTVNAVTRFGAKPVFCDIRKDTLNINEKLVGSLISDRTKAIVVVHYGGVGCEMDKILKIAGKYNIPVVEDNAHGLFGKFRDKFLGSMGTFGTLSFHETKNFICGEGGALLINNPAYIERAEIIREKGTDRSKLFRGEIDKYTWVDQGSSYLPSDLLAAFLYAQLEERKTIQNKRRQIWNIYNTELTDWAGSNRIKLPYIPDYCDQPYHLFYLIMPDEKDRDDMIKHLKDKGICAIFHYLPLHKSQMGIKLGGKVYDCPVTDEVSSRLIRLPFYFGLDCQDQQYIIDSVKEFYGQQS